MENKITRFRWIGFFLAMAMAILLTGSAAAQLIHTLPFREVQAQLIQIDSRYGIESNTRMMLYKTGLYQYTVEETSYVSPQAMLPISLRQVGSVYTVRYNPKNPAELRDTYRWITTTLAASVMILACIGIGMSLNKKQWKEN